MKKKEWVYNTIMDNKQQMLNINQFMKISNLELVDGVVMVTLDIYEDYLN